MILPMIVTGMLSRFVTGEVSSIVMKADEKMIEERSRVESMEVLLADSRLGDTLREEIRGHIQISQSSSTIDQDSLFRFVLYLSHYRS